MNAYTPYNQLPKVDIHTLVFTDPRHLLQSLETQLGSRPQQSNIIYAHAYKLAQKLNRGERIAPAQYWVALFSYPQQQQQIPTPNLDFVLAITSGPLGAYPVFIYSHHPTSHLTPAFLNPRVAQLAKRLADLVPPTRVFSVFAPEPLTRAFAASWRALTGFAVVHGDPWYVATSSFCTRETFRGATFGPSSEVVGEQLQGHELRKATLHDLDACATLCQEFAATSPPFTLDAQRARLEAEELIHQGVLWVYALPPVQSDTTNVYYKRKAIASIVAVTRSTPTVSAITKVYTTPLYRQRGCADRLVAHVTAELLYNQQKTAVVLFVGHTLDAVRVYERIGFAGLRGLNGGAKGPREVVEGVEDWLELGFEGAVLGHW